MFTQCLTNCKPNWFSFYMTTQHWLLWYFVRVAYLHVCLADLCSQRARVCILCSHFSQSPRFSSNSNRGPCYPHGYIPWQFCDTFYLYVVVVFLKLVPSSVFVRTMALYCKCPRSRTLSRTRPSTSAPPHTLGVTLSWRRQKRFFSKTRKNLIPEQRRMFTNWLPETDKNKRQKH